MTASGQEITAPTSVADLQQRTGIETTVVTSGSSRPPQPTESDPSAGVVTLTADNERGNAKFGFFRGYYGYVSSIVVTDDATGQSLSWTFTADDPYDTGHTAEFLGARTVGSSTISFGERTFEGGNTIYGFEFLSQTKGSMTMTVTYTTPAPHTLTFVDHGSTTATYQRIAGDPFLDAPAASPARGESFVGWFNAEGTIYYPNGAVGYGSMPDNDATYTAKYEQAPSYEISYDLAGGTLDGATAVASKRVYAEDAGLLPAGTPVRDGYEFAGWAYEGAAVDPSDTVSSLAGQNAPASLTLTAQWTAVEPEPTPGVTDPEKPETQNPEPSADKPAPKADTLPKTSDAAMALGAVAVMAAVAAGGVAVAAMRARKQQGRR